MVYVIRQTNGNIFCGPRPRTCLLHWAVMEAGVYLTGPGLFPAPLMPNFIARLGSSPLLRPWVTELVGQAVYMTVCALGETTFVLFLRRGHIIIRFVSWCHILSQLTVVFENICGGATFSRKYLWRGHIGATFFWRGHIFLAGPHFFGGATFLRTWSSLP